MPALLEIIRTVDVAIYQVLNGVAGNRWLDYFSSFEESDALFKGGLFLATYWYLWFREGPDQDKRRKAIMAVFVGALLALVACRIVADLLPFRVRPMYELSLQHHPYSFPVSTKLINWSGFPSDHATFFFALAFGLVYLSRRLGVSAMLYTSVWICLPRMFLGVHYASDIVAGAAVGIALVSASVNMERRQSGFSKRLLALVDTKPEVFYAFAFLGTFEMSVLFDDVRTAASIVYHSANVGSDRVFIHKSLVIFATLCLTAVTAYLVYLLYKRRRVRRETTA